MNKTRGILLEQQGRAHKWRSPVDLFTWTCQWFEFVSPCPFPTTIAGLNSEFSFSYTSCLTKAEEPSLFYYLPMAGRRIIGFIPFPRVLVLCEMQSVSSRIWIRVAVSFSYDDNHYTTGTSFIYMNACSIIKLSYVYPKEFCRCFFFSFGLVCVIGWLFPSRTYAFSFYFYGIFSRISICVIFFICKLYYLGFFFLTIRIIE